VTGLSGVIDRMPAGPDARFPLHAPMGIRRLAPLSNSRVNARGNWVHIKKFFSEENLMSAQIVLLAVFVLVGLTFALLLVDARRGSLAGDETRT
jgi:hypothetical protein